MATAYGTTHDLETWENITDSRFVIRKYTSQGEIASEMIGGHKKFHISPVERRLNQEESASDEQDPFSNGSLVPVRLIDGTEDAAEIAANPNLMSETEMHELVKGNIKGLRERLGVLKNSLVVAHLLEVAKADDVANSKVSAIDARLAELNPSSFTEIEHGGPLGVG